VAERKMAQSKRARTRHEYRDTSLARRRLLRRLRQIVSAPGLLIVVNAAHRRDGELSVTREEYAAYGHTDDGMMVRVDLQVIGPGVPGRMTRRG
jgi:hypothetical protein